MTYKTPKLQIQCYKTKLTKQVPRTHRLVGPDGVQEGEIVPGADFRQDEGQKAAVAIQLGVHEELKVKQVCDDVHSCQWVITETC